MCLVDFFLITKTVIQVTYCDQIFAVNFKFFSAYIMHFYAHNRTHNRKKFCKYVIIQIYLI